MTTIIIYLMVAILFLGMGIGYWIGTLPQRALEAEKKVETDRRREIWVEGQRDPDFEDTSDYG